MDQRLFFLINGHWSHPALDLPMAALSSWDFWWPIALVAGVLVAIFGGFRGRAALVCAGLAVGLTDGVVVDSIKNAVHRPRPNQELEHVRMVDLQKARPRFLAILQPAKVKWSKPLPGPLRGISFPSGHASNNFALAVVIAVFYRRWGWLYFPFAALISYSRIYVGSHYPSDTLVAMIIGAGVACLVLAACEALWKKFACRVAPRLFAAHPSLFAP
jgi:undecaprenyl-diphosphatase